jgi:hypothetical protein
LELVDHDGHAHLVLLGEVVEVAEHTLVHGCRRRRRTARKARVWGEKGGRAWGGKVRRDLKPPERRAGHVYIGQGPSGFPN